MSCGARSTAPVVIQIWSNPGSVSTNAERRNRCTTGAGADLLLNLWHSAPAPVVQRFRRSAFVDTDPGLLQIWMTTGGVDLAPHDIYFTIGETVGQPGAPFPDGGRAWLYT